MIRPGGKESSYRLARSDCSIAIKPLIRAVRRAGTPALSSLLAIWCATSGNVQAAVSPRRARRGETASGFPAARVQTNRSRRKPHRRVQRNWRERRFPGRRAAARGSAEAQRAEIGGALALFIEEGHRNVDETLDQRHLGLEGEQFQRAGQAYQFIGRLAAAKPVQVCRQKLWSGVRARGRPPPGARAGIPGS